MAFDPKEVISFDIEANPKKAIFEVTKFQRSLSAHMKKAQESTGKLDKGFGRLLKNIGHSRDKTAGLKQLSAQLKTANTALKTRAPGLEEILKRAKGAARGSDERKRAMAAATLYKKAHSIPGLRGARREAQKGVAQLQEEGPKFDWEEAGDRLAEPLHDMLSRDAPTMIKRLARIATGAHKLAVSTREAGGRLSDRGSAMMKKGGFTGTVVGGAAKAGGELTKMFGGLASVITKIGPILSVASSFMMSFIRIMIDAQAAAKDFNKQLLSTTSTAGYLSRNYGDVKAATADLGKSLDMARDAAKDASNVHWGISADEARAFQGAITAEGVALDRLGKANESATASTEQHIKTLHQGVAFARTFGVSISEIATMQGQLMSDIGMSADGATASFQSIVEGAKEAGMEANKFFGIVRGFSSDLSLFSLRLEDVAKIMGTLGKSMDPRKMGQFLQNLSGKFNEGVVGNMKYSAMAGGKGREIMQQDLAKKFEYMSADLKNLLGDSLSKEDFDSLTAAVKENNPQAVAQFTAKYRDKLNGPIIEELVKLQHQNARISSGSAIDLAAVMRNLSPLAKMQMLEAILVKQTGQGFGEIADKELAAMEQAGVLHEEDVVNYKQLRQGIMQGQEELINEAESGKLTPERLKQLAKLNINTSQSGAGMAKDLRELFGKEGGLQAYMNSLDKGQQEQIENAVKVRDFQEEAADLQTSMLDRLGMIYDVLMNKIYNVMQSVWTSVTDIYSWLKFGRDRGAEFSRAQAATGRSNDTQLQNIFAEALSKAGGDSDKALTGAKTEAIENVTGRALQALYNAQEEAAGITDRLKKEQDPRTKATLENRLTELKPALEMAAQYGGKSIKDVQDSLYEIGKREDLGGVPEVVRILSEMLKRGAGSPMAERKPEWVARAEAGAYRGDETDTSVFNQNAEGPAFQSTGGKSTAVASDEVAGLVASLLEAPRPEALIGGNVMNDAGAVPMVEGNEFFAGGEGFNQQPSRTDVRLTIVFEGDAKRMMRVQAQEVVTAQARNTRNG